jgi:hypothetical protein
MKRIIGKIDKRSGKITITTEGFEGATCLEATRKLEEGLGIKEPDRTLTPDYYKESKQEQQIGGA